MRKIFLTLPTMALLTLGCGHKLMQPPVAPDNEIAARAESAGDESVEILMPEGSPGDPVAHLNIEPKVGDFVVFRFSGSYRAEPLVMTQRVIAKPRPGQLIVDVELDDGDGDVHLRLRLRDVTGARGELMSVARLDDAGVQLPFGVTAYEQLMAKTMLSVDSNDMLLGSKSEEVNVGEQSLPAVKTSYRVSVKGAEATMETFESQRFPWGDVGGRIIAADGTVLYRAEVMQVGNRSLLAASQLAIQAGDELDEYDEYEE